MASQVCKDLESIRQLIEAKLAKQTGDYDSRICGCLPLHMAVMMNRLEYLSPLIKRGADINAEVHGTYGDLQFETSEGTKDEVPVNFNVIHMIVFLDLGTDALKAVLKLGADPTIRDSMSLLPIHLAAIFDRRKYIAVLLRDERVDIDAIDNNGYTALHNAVINSSEASMNLLIKRGAKVNTVNFNGVSPLMDAAICVLDGYSDLVSPLYEAGADYDYVLDHGCESVRSLVRCYVAASRQASTCSTSSYNYVF